MVHLICGLPGSGKTTLALKIAHDTNAVRFSADDWLIQIWNMDSSESEANQYRDKIEALQWKLCKDLLRLKTDCIIEWGVWSKEERELIRKEVQSSGNEIKLYVLLANKDCLFERIKNRNNRRNQKNIYIPDEKLDSYLDEWLAVFQIPSKDEMSLYEDFEVIKQNE